MVAKSGFAAEVMHLSSYMQGLSVLCGFKGMKKIKEASPSWMGAVFLF